MENSGERYWNLCKD